MFKRTLYLGLACFALFCSALQTYAAADVSTNSAAWSRNTTNTDIGTTGINVDTSFALAANNEKVEIAVMVYNSGDADSGVVELYRTGDLDGTYVADTLKKYQSGAWTDLNASWTVFNTEGVKLSLGTIPASSYIRVVYQIDVGGSHTYGDILQDYIKIYDTAALIKTLSVSTYVPYLKIQSANSGDNSIVLNSAIDLLETSAETIGNFEVSVDSGGSYTTLSGPSAAVYLTAGRTITLTQSQVNFNSGDNIVVRLSGVKTADDLRFLSPSNFTTNSSKVMTAVAAAVDTTSPNFTAGFDSIAGSKGSLLLTFDEPMNTSTISNANVLARTSFDNGHDLGTAPTISWTSTSAVKIILDSDGDVVAGDAVTLTSDITDTNSNAVNTSAVTIAAIVLDAPVINTFTIADQTSSSTLYTNSRTIDVTSFIASDSDGIVSGYLVNESAVTPALSEINNNVAPLTYSITGAEGSRTIYAWVKDNDAHITGGTSKVINLDLVDPVVTADIATGTYNSAQTVTLSFATEVNPDKIYYTLDGSTPDNTDTQYTVPLSINSNTVLKLIGYDLAVNVSTVMTRTYTFDLVDPVVTADIATGTYNSAQTVTLSFVAEANPDKIYYTLDGSTPDNTDLQYVVPLSINSNTVLKLIGYDLVGNASRVITRTYTFACNPSSVTNGLIGAYPTCTLSCNSGYGVSGSSCVVSSSSSSSGGGGGGGSTVNTTTIYNLPTLPSESTVKSYRPIKVSGSIFTRPVTQTNYYIDAVTEIPFETEIYDLEGKTLTGAVLYPIDRVKSADVTTDLRIPNPPEPLVYSRYYQFGSLNEKFSKEIDLSIPVTSSVLKLEPTEFHIYKWIPGEGDSVVSSGGLVYRVGEWVKMGDGTMLDANGILSFSTTYSTLIAFTSNDGSIFVEDEEIDDVVEEESLTPFVDIVGHWAEQFIENLYLKGVINGKTATNFDPNANLTRAELTKIALKSSGFEVSENVTEKPFSDVALNTWYLGFVTKAKESGVLAGYADGTFRPNQPVNRSEALKILIEAAGIDTNGYEATFLDTDSEAWYAPYIAYAKKEGIVEGYAAQVAMPKVMSGSKIADVSDVYAFNRYLGKGNTGEDVKDLQKILVLLGYFKGELTGEFDEATVEALIQFQFVSKIITSEQGLGSGYLGPLTLEMLLKEKIENQVEFETQTQYYFKPGQFITRAEIAKIAVSLIED